MPTIPDIKTLLTEGRTQQAIEALLQLTAADEELHTEAIQLSARYSQHRRTLHAGTHSNESLNLESRRIEAAILELLRRSATDTSTKAVAPPVPTPPKQAAEIDKEFDWKKLLVTIAGVAAFVAALAEISGYSLRDLWTEQSPPNANTATLLTTEKDTQDLVIVEQDTPAITLPSPQKEEPEIVKPKPRDKPDDQVAPPPAPAPSQELQLRAWAEREPAIYRAGEDVRFFYEVNRPCYVRVLYQLADGSIILLADDYQVSSEKTGRQLEIGDGFTVAEPFGREQLYIFVQSEPFPKLMTTPHPDDPDYTLVTEGLPSSLRKTRGLKKKRRFAESKIDITTQP